MYKYGQGFLRHKFEECNDINSTSRGDIFKSPCLKTNPSAFVAERSKYSTLPDYSPLPDAFSNVADEDLWLKMNNGYVADLDSLQTTPTRKVQSFPTSDTTPVSLYLLNCFLCGSSFMSCTSILKLPSTSTPRGTRWRSIGCPPWLMITFPLLLSYSCWFRYFHPMFFNPYRLVLPWISIKVSWNLEFVKIILYYKTLCIPWLICCL